VRTYARLLLRKEATYDEVVQAHDDLKDSLNSCAFDVFVTRLSDLKTVRVVTLDNEGPYEGNFARHWEEAGEQGLVFGSYRMDLLSISMFAGNAGNDENEAVICGAFNPSQVQLYLDFWETRQHGDGPPLGGAGPEGEMYMEPDELKKYLVYHAPWSLN